VFEICQIGDDERAELFEVVQRYWAGLMPQAPVVQDPTIRPQYFESQFRFGEPGSYQWWAILNSVKIGFANAELSEDWIGQVWAYIKDFYVEPHWRRQGHGRAFIRALMDWMAGQDVYRIDLQVRSDNPSALAFWQSVGFDLASYRMRTYLDWPTG
jgi:ribosomal protein S18 acetylase RimI-like enzyme